ncbi:uncharacterized protein ARMOST_21781 [Armillaria ostoyae]|uniref:RNA-directed DNA polymerase n=1 Tax=Armillaria ostoyae TaxID=47428 RepID=A0A284SB09_ARMOS|nr:uncharacterized protein ARMOST_21781 [Armillaria ostoyae]
MALKGSTNRSPARAEAKVANPAGHKAESLSMLPNSGANRLSSSSRQETRQTKESDNKSPTIQSESSPPEEAAPQEENTTRSLKDDFDVAGATTFSSIFPRGIVPIALSDAPRPKVARRTGNSTFAVPVQPIVRTTPAVPKGDTLQVRQLPPLTQKENDEDHQARPSKAASDANATATKETATGKEAASAQAVNRGHPVVMVEVPDEEDDTAYKIWLTKERTLAITKKEATSNEPARSSTTSTTMRGWCKPFEVDWTLRAICEAQNDNATRAALFVWAHKDRIPELTEELLEQLRQGGEITREQLYKLCEPPCYLRRRQSNNKDFMLDVQLIPCTGRQILQTQDTKKTAVPIAVYNADGTCNKAGDITEFVEFQMTIGNHSEQIDFAITNLSSRDLYLGHDWLKHHNPVINWETGTIIFRRCQCIKNPFPLPNADPDNRWDEELEDGDMILAINMEEELVIRAVHHANDLAAAAHTDKPKKTFEEMVPPDYCSFHDLFSKENFDELPERKPWDHAIKLIPNAKSTLDCKVYLLNQDEQEQLDKFLDENLESGCICKSKSPFTSPFFFVKKKDSSLRPIQDYCKLNEMTIKNRYLLPLISELIDKLQGAKYFTKLDVRWGYNNVRIREGDEEKAAFCTNHGLFEPTIMFFGLTNSPATFQWMMNDIFKDLISEGKVTIYLDDILIFTKDLDEHRQILFLKAEKCEFEVLESEYLSVIISEGQVCMDPVKLAGIAERPTPTKKKELQSFLGFTNFYRKFIKNYSKVVRALTQLTGNAEWTWGAMQNQAFQQLKKQMAEDVILTIPNRVGRFRVEADASNGAISTVLSQEQEGRWRPELLAIMLALAEWRHYLMGALEDVEIWTDHQNLQYFRKPQKLN